VTHQLAACDAASVHFGQTIRRTDIFVIRMIRPVICTKLPLTRDVKAATLHHASPLNYRPRGSAVADEPHDALRHSRRVVNKDGH